MDLMSLIAAGKSMFGGGGSTTGVNPMAPVSGAAPMPFLANPNPMPNSPLAPVAAAPVQAVPADNKILGMNPNTFASLSGMLAGALTPKDSWQSRVGQVATQTAQTQTLANAQLKRDQDHQKFLTEALKYYHPSVVGKLADMTAGHTGYFDPSNGVGNPAALPMAGQGGK